MKIWTLAIALGAVACLPKTDPGNGGSRDTDPTIEDTDVDDTDVEDTDTAEDTDTDTAEDTAPIDTANAACRPSDLEFRLEVRGADGQPTETLTPTDLPTLAGLVTNTCADGPVIFETETNCLVMKWTITDENDVARAIEPMCTTEKTRWNVPADGVREVTYRLEAQPVGAYDVEVNFAMNDETAEASFEVAPAEPPAVAGPVGPRGR